jgi:hypothetical protein
MSDEETTPELGDTFTRALKAVRSLSTPIESGNTSIAFITSVEHTTETPSITVAEKSAIDQIRETLATASPSETPFIAAARKRLAEIDDTDNKKTSQT